MTEEETTKMINDAFEMFQELLETMRGIEITLEGIEKEIKEGITVFNDAV